MLQHAELDQIPISAIKPKMFPLPTLEHEAKALIQPKDVPLSVRCKCNLSMTVVDVAFHRLAGPRWTARAICICLLETLEIADKEMLAHLIAPGFHSKAPS